MTHFVYGPPAAVERVFASFCSGVGLVFYTADEAFVLTSRHRDIKKRRL